MVTSLYNEEDIQYCGYLDKKGVKNASFKKRYFILSGTTLTYYEDDKTKKPSGEIDLTKGIGVREKGDCSSTVTWPKRIDILCFGVATTLRTFYLAGEDVAEVAKWKAAIQKVIDEHGVPITDPSGDVEDPEGINKRKIAIKSAKIGAKVACITAKKVFRFTPISVVADVVDEVVEEVVPDQ